MHTCNNVSEVIIFIQYASALKLRVQLGDMAHKGALPRAGAEPSDTYISVPVDLCIKSIWGPIRFLL